MREERLLALEIHHATVNEACSGEVLELIAEVRRLKDALRESVTIANIAGDRIKELEDLIPELEVENNFVRARNERLEQENERLEKALEFYVNKAQEIHS